MSLLAKNIAYLRDAHPELKIGVDPTISDLESIAEKLNLPIENLLLFPMYAEHLPWKDIRFIFLDVDGVMTEGGMFYTESGDEFKRFDTKDGMAIKLAMKEGLEFGIISSGVNRTIIQHRADMFGIKHVYVGTAPKLEIAEQWLKALKLQWSEVAYIGDDVNDLSLFERSAIAVCPSDATVPIKKVADLVLLAKGGHGCIREFMRSFPQLKSKL